MGVIKGDARSLDNGSNLSMSSWVPGRSRAETVRHTPCQCVGAANGSWD